MKLRTNKIMDSYISKLGYDFLLEKVQLPKELEDIVNCDFLTDNDCVILKGLYKHESNPEFDDDFRKCEWEYNETHFHPDMFADETKGEMEYLKLALECGKCLMARFIKDFKERKFRIDVSFSETEMKDGEIEKYGSSTVRFYQIRETCDYRMRIKNLDDFKQEAILEMEIS